MNLLLRCCFQRLIPFPETTAFPATGQATSEHGRQEQEHSVSFAFTMTLKYLSSLQSRLETSVSESCFICHHVHMFHTHAAQHAGLTATVDLRSPTTSFQCLKSQKGKEAVELCCIEGTLLLSSRTCGRSRFSRLWSHATLTTFSSWKT